MCMYARACVCVCACDSVHVCARVCVCVCVATYASGLSASMCVHVSETAIADHGCSDCFCRLVQLIDVLVLRADGVGTSMHMCSIVCTYVAVAAAVVMHLLQ